MKIGIEAERANVSQKTGVEHYAHQLITELANIDLENEYILYVRTQPAAWMKRLPGNFKVKQLAFPFFWTQLRLSWELFWHRVDVLFIPASTMPLYAPKHTVVTVHDVAWKMYPEAFTWFNRTYLHTATKTICRRAWRIICVSKSTATDLIHYYRPKPENIRVVLHGYDATAPETSTFSAELAPRIPKKYILFLSTIQPRKNLPFLIDTFVKLKQKHPEIEETLVVAGKLGWQVEDSVLAIQNHPEDVVYLGHISDSDRWALYRSATVFVHPTLYEGFGMWMLEAFACNVPVLVSNVSSLPEVGGDAAWYFNPTNSAELEEKLLKLLHNESQRKKLVEAGQARLKEFSWKQCAEQTQNIFKELET